VCRDVSEAEAYDGKGYDEPVVVAQREHPRAQTAAMHAQSRRMTRQSAGERTH
jgi:hypothetical protein